MVILSEKHPQGWNFKPYTEKLPFIHVEGQYHKLKLWPNHNSAIVWTLKAMNFTIWTKLSQKHQKTKWYWYFCVRNCKVFWYVGLNNSNFDTGFLFWLGILIKKGICPNFSPCRCFFSNKITIFLAPAY